MIEQYGLGQVIEKGEHFEGFCAFDDLIGGTIFSHRRIHKVRWMPPDAVTENQNDHICFSIRFTFIQEWFSRRRADVSLISKLKPLKSNNHENKVYS